MWIRGGAFAAVALTIAAVLLVACRQVAGIADGPPENLTSASCGLPYDTTACASCVHAKCCDESNACTADTACSAFEICARDCKGDPTCLSKCAVDHPTGASSAVPRLSACIASDCDDACGVHCGDMAAQLTPPDASAPCESCFETTTACGAAKACAASIDCDTYARCFVGCQGRLDCREACQSDNDAGFALFAPVWDAYSTTCARACAFGNNWSCIGHLRIPAPTASSVTAIVTVADLSSTPVPGVDIRVAYEPPFDVPLAEATTDDAGTASLTIKPFPGTPPGTVVPAGVPFQPLPFLPWLQATSPDIVTAWLTGTAPSTLARDSYPVQVLTPAQLATAAQVVSAPPQDSGLAVVGFAAYDCLGSSAPNVTFALSGVESPMPVHYYMGNTPDSTGTTGTALAFNVPVDAGLLAATASTAGSASSFSKVSYVFVQAGTETLLVMNPNQ